MYTISEYCAFFLSNSELGIEFLVDKKFIAPQPDAIAKFLLTRKGLSRKIIGEYLSNRKMLTNAHVLQYVVYFS